MRYTVATNARPLIRISKRSYATLKALSKDTKTPMSDLAAAAIERYSDERFWDEVDRELEAMTPEQWRQYRKEFAEWDAMPGPPLPADDWSELWRADQKRIKAEARRRVVGGSRSRSRPRAGRTTTGGRRVG
jgi:hypothetical protein